MVPDSDKTTISSLEKFLGRYLNEAIVTQDNQVVWYIKKAFVARVNDLVINIYPKDHPERPHFHINSKQRKINARLEVESLELMPGDTISKDDYKKIIYFFQKVSPESYEKLKNMAKRLYSEK